MVLTNASDNLRLHAKLVLEARSKVRDSSFAIASHVGHLSDLVEHVSTGEHKDCEEAETSPELAALDERQEVRVCRDGRSYATKAKDGPGEPSHPVDGSSDRGLGPTLQMAGNPRVDLLGDLRTVAVLDKTPWQQYEGLLTQL
jgi:hypothetical protein